MVGQVEEEEDEEEDVEEEVGCAMLPIDCEGGGGCGAVGWWKWLCGVLRC